MCEHIKTNLFTGPEWKLDGGPGYGDDNRPNLHTGPLEGDGSHAHFGPFDPPAPLQYGPPEGWGTVLHK